jgi:acyl-CoA synthetase (AMP-forming)/AMP-acid ligase II
MSVAALLDRLATSRRLFEPVFRHAERAPERPFLILEKSGATHVLTFGALAERASRWAAAFRARGVGEGEIVAFMLSTHAELAPAFLGAIVAGAVPSIFPAATPKQDPDLFWAAHRELFGRLRTPLILTDRRNAELAAARLPEFAAAIVDLDGDLPLPPAGQSNAVAAGGEIALLQHSSGTTGLKKGVMLGHRAVLDAVGALGAALGLTERDLIASWLPLYHDMGLIACLVLPMLCGLTVVQLDPFEWVLRPATILDAIERHRATLCWMPNFAFHHILRTVPPDAAWDLGAMRAFIGCSEPCKPETFRGFRARFARCGLAPQALQASYALAENVFGATQTAPDRDPAVVAAEQFAYAAERRITAPQPGEPALEFLSMGPPIPGTRLRILDEAGSELADRRVGEIALASPYLFSGYAGLPLPAGKLREGWYRTGDLGFTVAGELFVCGRLDDLLIINGRNIYAHDVEFSVNRHTAVKPGRCVAIGPYNRRTGSESLVVIAETEAAGPDARRELARAVQRVVEAEFGVVPYDVHLTAPGWLVKTTSGKISREANAKKYLAEGRLP